MNLSLIDPFVLAQDYPESLAGTLRSGHATCLRFNRKGDFLASGRADGTVVIFDIETNGVARKLRGHTRQIQSLSWSRDGRYLLSSSQDWKCVLWDLKDGSRVRTVRFEAPVYIAELHPYNHLLFVASLFEDQPKLVDLSTTIPTKHVLPSAPKRQRLEGEDASTEKQDAKHTTCVTVFTASGHHILAGTNKGWFNIIETATCQTIYSTRLSTGVIIFLRLTASGRDMVVNSSDRILRTILMPNLTDANVDPDSITIEVEHKFQDVVNRLSWNHVAFSSTGEYVTASTYKNHDIYVWERSHGSLVKILEGPKEELGVVEWHPHRPYVAACGLESGHIYLWAINTPQRWSALAPDFAEVEENVEYIEREDEFDIHPIEEIHKRRLDLEDEDVDVLTVEPTKELGYEDDEEVGRGGGPLGSDDEDGGGGAFRMPVLLDISESESEEEIVAVGPGTMRRKSPGAGREWMDSGGGGGSDARNGAAENGASDMERATTNGTASRSRRKR
ncbi:MAG: Nitrogen permease regulator 2 [Chaenotheca gracillima]|nr:MAG: Nitrogen permease regulator 2 [Chaenotheca gracillima]